MKISKSESLYVISLTDIHVSFDSVKFDIIKNRFIAILKSKNESDPQGREVLIDRNIFSSLFNSLASTPAGQPFIAEEKQYKMTKHLVEILKGGK